MCLDELRSDIAIKQKKGLPFNRGAIRKHEKTQ